MTAAPVQRPCAVQPTHGGDTSKPLSPEQFLRIKEWVYQRTGMRFEDNKRYFVDKRVQLCVQQAGGDFDAWFATLRKGSHGESAQRLINELTVNETYFLREDRQFDDLVSTLLPGILDRRRATGSDEPIRILSLPCSTGEEPYSIGLRLLEDWPDIADTQVEIVAGDIDTRVLEKARRGEYGVRSLHRVPRKMRLRWFDQTETELFRLKADLRDAIDFACVNVCDSGSMRPFRQFDVVFCRNLLIYFDQLSAQRATENLFGALRPGGYLFLGDAESMSRNMSIFEPIRLREGIVYQRPAIGATR